MRGVTVLNDKQREAIRAVDGPVLVLAGAGTGKTRVIAHKVQWLIEKRDVAPATIAAITFTNKAAREMRARIRALLGQGGAPELWVSTFHTLGLRILRQEFAALGLRNGFSIFDAGDCAALIADLMRRELPGSELAIAAVQQCISTLKQPGGSAAIGSAEYISPAQQLAARCYADYCDTLGTFNAVDFDDLITLPLRCFQDSPDVLDRWRGRIRYLLVDEYQDTNLAQYELVKLLAGDGSGFTVVGDDDQSIYAWRGARPENIEQLEHDFPTLKVVKLEQNYRSTGTILAVANTLIANNPHKFTKRLWSEHGFGDKIRILACASEDAETEKIANEILHRRMLNNFRFGDFAVLLRSNHQARAFEHVFRERDIPYVLSGGISFFDYSEIKDCVSYFRLLANACDDNAFLRIVNVPRRAIGSQTVNRLVEYAAAGHLGLLEAAVADGFAGEVSPLAYKRVRAFADWMADFAIQHQAAAPADACARLLDDIQYDDWLEQSSATAADAVRRRENVAELKRWIRRIQPSGDSKTLADVIAALTLFDIAERRENDEEADEVALMTIHSAKGLEFKHVFLAGFEECLLPHRNSIDADTIEEERRLAYVGITRAQRSLTVSFSRTRKRFGQLETIEPSRFLEELPADELLWEGANADREANEQAGRGTLDKLKSMLRT